jgi:hypothetical protein
MRIKKKNIARLASLSAVGAGALGVAAGTAEAGVIYSGPLTEKVGFSKGYGSLFTESLGALRLGVFTSRTGSFSGFSRSVKLGGTGFYFGKGIALPGETWNNLHSGSAAITTVLGKLRGAFLTSHIPGPWTQASGTNGNFYKLFRYQPPLTSPLYGWIYLDETVNLTNGGTGPDVEILGVAYDDKGNVIAAGDTGVVPEPSSMTLTGLAAMALGAVGLRRWRAARKTAA